MPAVVASSSPPRNQCTCMAGVDVWQVWMYGRCGCMAGVRVWQVCVYGRCGCMSRLPAVVWTHRLLNEASVFAVYGGAQGSHFQDLRPTLTGGAFEVSGAEVCGDSFAEL